MRESPALYIARRLRDEKIGRVVVCEPNVSEVNGFEAVSLQAAIAQCGHRCRAGRSSRLPEVAGVGSQGKGCDRHPGVPAMSIARPFRLRHPPRSHQDGAGGAGPGDRGRGSSSRVCVTGQHRQMLDQVLDIFSIKPDHDLEPDAGGAGSERTDRQDSDSRCAMSCARMRPHLVVVQGDTTTCMATALAAFYERIPIAHVEAGLRSGRLDAPFPEEANRCIVSRIADLHFAPTHAGAGQPGRAREFPPSRIAVTGNTVIDALLLTRDRVSEVSHASLDQPARRRLVRCARRPRRQGHPGHRPSAREFRPGNGRSLHGHPGHGGHRIGIGCSSIRCI